VVDYYVHFKDFSEPVSTTDLKLVLNQELQGFRPNGSADGVAALGRFQVDPNYTDFIVVDDGFEAPVEEVDDGPLPDWAIAVVVIGLGSFAFVLIFGLSVMTNRRSRRSNKKKHDVPLTEDMLNELNKNSMGGYGGHRGHPGDMGGHGGHHGPSGGGHGGGMGAYDNYGQDPDEFYDLDDVWNNDRYNFGQNRYKRQSNMSSSTSGGGGGGGGGYSKSTNTASPYQSQLYDSWKTEWGGTPAAYGYDQGQAGYRSGPGGSSGGEPDPYHSNKLERHRERGSYMTKGGRRPSYDDDF